MGVHLPNNPKKEDIKSHINLSTCMYGSKLLCAVGRCMFELIAQMARNIHDNLW